MQHTLIQHFAESHALPASFSEDAARWLAPIADSLHTQMQ